MKTFQQLKESLEKIEKFESEINIVKQNIQNLLKNEELEKFLDPEEYQKRKRRERNRRYYQKRLKK